MMVYFDEYIVYASVYFKLLFDFFKLIILHVLIFDDNGKIVRYFRRFSL
jgi:hypothetical protein